MKSTYNKRIEDIRQPNPPSKYKSTQRAFAMHIKHPDLYKRPPNLEVRRVDIYNKLFFNNISQLLSSGFPLSKILLGEARWKALIRCFFSENVSFTPLFPYIGKEFVNYIESKNIPIKLPLLLQELISFERLEVDVSLAQVLDEHVVVNKDFIKTNVLNDLNIKNAGRFSWVEGICIQHYTYPVHTLNVSNCRVLAHTLFEGAQFELNVSEHGYQIITYRTYDFMQDKFNVRYEEISPATLQLLDLICNQNISLDDAMDALYLNCSHIKREIFDNFIFDALKELLQKSIIRLM